MVPLHGLCHRDSALEYNLETEQRFVGWCEMSEFADLLARYSKGTLTLRQRLDLPEGTEVRVTVSTKQRPVARRGSKRKYQYPTRVVSWAALDRLTSIASLGGDAVADSEALYDHD